MNDKPEIEVGKLPVITKFIYTLGVLPTSYLMSMTYQEQVTWLYNYLQTQVIPLLNTESGAIQELQTLYELLRKYVNDYFDNLDVQEEINNKLDEMITDGTLTTLIANYINPIINEQNTKISAIENQVQSVASGSPLVASSTSDMTDTSRIYVNTSDGYWYYYNGSTWERGGVYQATEDSTTLTDLVEDYNNYKEKTTNISPNRFDKNADTTKTNYYYTGNIGETLIPRSNNDYYCGIIPAKPGETITFSSSGFKILGINDSNEILSYSESTVQTPQHPFTYTIPNTSGITKVAISWKKTGSSAVSLDNYMAVKGDTLPSTYIPYGYIFNESYIDNLKSEMNIDYEIEKLDNLITNYNDYKEKTVEISPNMFNKDNVIYSKYANGNIGKTISLKDNSDFCCYSFDIEPGKPYIISGKNFQILIVDEEDTVLQAIGASDAAVANYNFTPSLSYPTAKKAWISWRPKSFPVDSYMILEGNIMPENYLPYGYVFNENYIEKLNEEIEGNENKEFFVGYGLNDNERYFTSLVDCLYKVQETSGFKTVHIKNGVYDILSELGGMEYINSKNTTDDTWRTVQPIITDTKIIGHGNVILNFNLETTTNEHYWLFSALNISGNCELENIEIHSSNCRYSIHDESGDDYQNTYRKYKNVRCYNSSTQACGCGYSQNTNVYIDNCIFETNSQVEGYSCHANNGVKVIINNSVFKSNNSGSDLRISQNGGIGTNGRIYAEISNCFLHHGLSVRNEYDNTVTDRTEVNLINTYVGNLSHQYTDIVQPVTSFNTLTGEKKILLNVTE